MKKTFFAVAWIIPMILAGTASAHHVGVDGYGSGWNMMGSWGTFGGVTMVLFWILLVLGIIAIIKWIKKDDK